MKTYQVGGSVRDQLMGLTPQDRDWVVIGANESDLLKRDFRKVGADFPVFLHPQTQEEYALARVERKTGVGHLGFEVSTQNVTLEEDLSRRDLTINAMALDEDGRLVDPFGGHADIQSKTFRHVSPAFVEDPVRILRIFRFMGRFGPGWKIAGDTQALLERMIEEGEADALVPARIWKEVSRGLMEPHADLFVDQLFAWGLTVRPRFSMYKMVTQDLSQARALGAVPFESLSLAQRYALAFGGADHRTYYLQDRSVPWIVARIALLWCEARQHLEWLDAPEEHAACIYGQLLAANGFRDSSDMDAVVKMHQALGRNTRAFESAVQRAQAVDTQAISASMPPGPQVGKAIMEARIQALQNFK